MNCLCAGTRRAARLITQLYEDELSQAGVTAAQFELMGTLLARPGIPQSDLADALSLNQTTLSRNLAVLIGRKWIHRTGSSKDKRMAIFSLSEDGDRAWHRALPHWRNAQASLRKSLGGDWRKVRVALERLGSIAIPNR